MAKRCIRAVLILSIAVPLIVFVCGVIIVVLVIPNSGHSGQELDSGESEGHKDSGDKASKEQQMLVAGGRVLFVTGLIVACGLFVILIIVVVVVIVWARQARGYIFDGRNPAGSTSPISASGKNEACQLTHHLHHRDNNITESRQCKKDPGNSTSSKENALSHSSVVSLPHPPVKTVAVSAKIGCKDSETGTVSTDPYYSIGSSGDRDTSLPAQNYGSLSRTRILPSVDEEGYHLDNLGFEFNEIASGEHFLPTFDDVLESPDVKPEKYPGNTEESELEKESESSVFPLESQSDPASSPPPQKPPLEKQLSKQDSFQGLPPFKSFDKYLTLVRLDSTTSVESSTLEEARKQWQSIEEEEEENHQQELEKKPE